MPVSTTDRYAYATYPDFNQLSYNCIKHLMHNDEEIWKLLKYGENNAWDKTDLTYEEKVALIYDGSDDGTNFRVFLDTGLPDVWTREDCILRIAPYSIYPENRTVGTITMAFEAFSFYKINTLSNYTTRVDTIMQRLIEVFNGEKVGGIGRLFFDRMGSQADRLEIAGQSPFKGKFMLMSVKSA